MVKQENRKSLWIMRYQLIVIYHNYFRFGSKIVERNEKKKNFFFGRIVWDDLTISHEGRRFFLIMWVVRLWLKKAWLSKIDCYIIFCVRMNSVTFKAGVINSYWKNSKDDLWMAQNVFVLWRKFSIISFDCSSALLSKHLQSSRRIFQWKTVRYFA